MTKSNPGDLAGYIADIILSKHNQSYSTRFIGRSGSGKSWSALELCEGVSERIAYKLGGKPEDYFCFEKDLAVMSASKLEEVLTNAGKYHVILADDLGTMASARDFASTDNKNFTKVIQAWRPNHNFLCTTTISGFLVDKIFRLLANSEIEIESSNHDMGYNIAKVKQINYNSDLGKVFHPYLVEDGISYKRHIFTRPSEEIIVKYEAERAIQLRRLMDMEKQPIESKTEKLTKETFYTPMILKICKDGYIPQKEIINQLNIICGSAPSQKTISEILIKNNITKIK